MLFYEGHTRQSLGFEESLLHVSYMLARGVYEIEMVLNRQEKK